MKMQHQPHRSWLLRLRYLNNAGHPRWVITIEEPGSGRQERVRDLQALMKVLEEKMQGPTLALPREGTAKE